MIGMIAWVIVGGVVVFVLANHLYERYGNNHF